jgi:L-iditol 2-dehydrogenase
VASNFSPVTLIPDLMSAAVYRGESRVVVEQLPTPQLQPGELLIRVEACGICHTDLKKVEYNLLPPPRIYGHETAGVVAAVGEGAKYSVGDRVIAFHHIPCKDCFYCDRRLYAQCSTYKKVGITAGFEPAGGGFAQYVRVMDWIAARGVERIPAGVGFDVASFVEPVNTCLKAVHQSDLGPRDTVGVLGQGPIGLVFTALAKLRGSRVLATDTMGSRLKLSSEFGADEAVDARADVDATVRKMTENRGLDVVFLATSAPKLVEQAIKMTRPGGRIVLFAQTSEKERIDLAGSDICVGERMLTGSYSADVDLQAESAQLVFGGQIPIGRLISHRLPLARIEEGISIARRPTPESLKVVIEPNQSEGQRKPLT